MEVFVQNGTMYFDGIFSLLANVLGVVSVSMVLVFLARLFLRRFSLVSFLGAAV